MTQERIDEHKELDAVNRHMHELESENKFPRKVAAFFAGSLC
ncbi:hypothetical protein [Atopobium sp. oral taxon 416]|nr:hypothetical protein [Atopobium sp. oral taxon 416]